MEQKKKHCGIPFADLPLILKFVVILLLMVAALCLITLAMIQTVTTTQKEKYRQMEDTSIIAAEQVMNFSVETAVSIAKNIYTNDAVYEFLNTHYTTSAAYYETYYPLQQNTAMNLADTNIIRSCIIYTDNPTVLAGGNIKKLEDARQSHWFQSFQKMGKPIILCMDPETSVLMLVRKLDYRALETGESYLCLELNNLILPQFAESLGFDGELYVVSGSNLIYSSSETVTDANSFQITQDYDCLIRNYYTIDIGFYSRASRLTFVDYIKENLWLLIGFTVALVLLAVFSFYVFYGMKIRIRPLLAESPVLPEKGISGRDEIGLLLDRLHDLTENGGTESGEAQMNNESVQRQRAEYDALFRTAMRLDAELIITNLLPELKQENQAEDIPLAEEAKMLEQLAEKRSAQFVCEELPDGQWLVPAYSLVLIADGIFQRFIDPTVRIFVSDEETVAVAFESPVQPKSTESLKLRAIFEDNNVSEVYDFTRNYRFNPYMRLKACLGDSADIELTDKNLFRLVIKLKQQGGTS